MKKKLRNESVLINDITISPLNGDKSIIVGTGWCILNSQNSLEVVMIDNTGHELPQGAYDIRFTDKEPRIAVLNRTTQ